MTGQQNIKERRDYTKSYPGVWKTLQQIIKERRDMIGGKRKY